VRPEFTIAQLTDPHIGADWIADPSGALAAAVATVRTVLHRPPDCAVITGDIADDATDSQYAEARRCSIG
jgi:3',5'-cyclic AMP phosphodiesterase CpdA